MRRNAARCLTTAVVLVSGCSRTEFMEPADTAAFVKSTRVRAADGARIEITAADNPGLAGTALDIPPGSLTDDTEITVQLAPSDIVEQLDAPIGAALEWGPAGTQFTTGAVLTLRFTLPDGETPAAVFVQVVEADGARRELFQPELAVDLPAGLASATIDGFTRFQPGIRGCPSGDPAPEQVDHSCPPDMVCERGKCVVASCDGDPQLGEACDGADADTCAEGVWSCVDGALLCGDETGDTAGLCNGPVAGPIVYVADDSVDSNVCTIAADGTGGVTHTDAEEPDQTPRFSPDGGYLAWYRYNQIWVMRADGSGKAQLTDGLRDQSPRWSPDGSRILYATDRDGGPFEIYVMNADGSGKTNLSRDAASNDWSPEWSPDGTHVAHFTELGDIFLMRSDGSERRLVTAGRGPIWSADGTLIAFTRYGANTGSDLWVMDADGTNERTIAATPAFEGLPAWSPTSRRLAYVSDADGDNEIYVADVDGAGATPLTNDPRSDLYPRWSPDGARILFQTIETGQPRYQLWVMNADGGSPLRIVDSATLPMQTDWGVEPPAALPPIIDPDVDEDGVVQSADCDDIDATSFPGASERCDGRDNDCNGLADAPGGETDPDGDGVLSCAVP